MYLDSYAQRHASPFLPSPTVDSPNLANSSDSIEVNVPADVGSSACAGNVGDECDSLPRDEPRDEPRDKQTPSYNAHISQLAGSQHEKFNLKPLHG